MVNLFIMILETAQRLFLAVVVINVFLSYVMPPYHRVRQTLDRVVEPFLKPIRKILPPIGIFDFSPLVLIILVQLIVSILVRILGTMR